MAQTLNAFQIIADPSRRQILYMLSKESHTINSLAENFDMSRPAVSKHIKALYQCGFISIEDIGRERHCMLKQEGFNELKGWLAYYDKFWQSKLRNLEDLLNKNEKNVNHKKPKK
jgi:DNA-binding transcriptional ArsR family regulator